MDARPTPEQRQLDDAAARLAEKLGVNAVGDLDDHERRDRLEAALDRAGWRQLRAGDRDQPWASGVEVALVARRLARRACDVAYLGPVLAHDLARRAGAEVSAATVAVSPDLCTLAVDGGLAIDAAGAGDALALDSAGDVAAVALDPARPGPVGESAAGRNRPLDLTRAVVPVAPGTASTAIGTVDHDSLVAWEALAVALTAADLVGAMDGAFQLAADYAAQRRQFGAPIGSFQAVQHLLAEAKSLIEGAHSAMLYAAWAVDALEPADARAAAAVAKAYAARAARTVCETSIQVHGGIGNTWECMAHVFLRRVLVSTELFGGDGRQLTMLARQRWGAVDGLS